MLMDCLLHNGGAGFLTAGKGYHASKVRVSPSQRINA